MNALSELRRMPETKAQVESFAAAAVNEIMSGNVNPVEVEVRLKMIEDAIKLIRSNQHVKNLLVEQVEQGRGEALGAKLTLSRRTTYDFTNDPVYNLHKSEMKAREIFLKGMKGVDPETGEIVMCEKVSEFLTIKY